MEKKYDIVFVKPKNFEDCQKCIEHIKGERIVHINLAELEREESQRILDYISGAVYIKEGEIIVLGDGIFCAIPKDKNYQFEYKTGNSGEIEEIKRNY